MNFAWRERPLRAAERADLEAVLAASGASAVRRAAPLIGLVAGGLTVSLGWYVALPAGVLAATLALGALSWVPVAGVIAALCFLARGEPVGAGIALGIASALGIRSVLEGRRNLPASGAIDVELVKEALRTNVADLLRLEVVTALPLLGRDGRTAGVFIPLSFESLVYLSVDPQAETVPCGIYEVSPLPQIARRWSGSPVPTLEPLSQVENGLSPIDGGLYAIPIGTLLAAPEKLAPAYSGSLWERKGL